MEIIPAIMPESCADLNEKADRIVGLVPWAQIDVMDGVFVSSTSWPYNRTDEREFDRMVQERRTLPHNEEMHYEIDLMVADPCEAARPWLALGACRIIAHVESVPEFDVTALFRELRAQCQRDVEVVAAIGTTTDAHTVGPLFAGGYIDGVQCMGIETIGYQGQPFDSRVLMQLRELRSRHKDAILSVDGGVSVATAPQLIAAGADRLVAGSAIFNSEDSAAALQQLFRTAHHG